MTKSEELCNLHKKCRFVQFDENPARGLRSRAGVLGAQNWGGVYNDGILANRLSMYTPGVFFGTFYGKKFKNDLAWPKKSLNQFSIRFNDIVQTSSNIPSLITNTNLSCLVTFKLGTSHNLPLVSYTTSTPSGVTAYNSALIL